MEFDPVKRYNLNEIEAKAYGLYLIWLDRSKKAFPDYNHPREKKGDPRKSIVWKYCYKTVYNFGQVLPQTEYALYVRAQLEIIKHYKKEAAVIDASCLCGEKAWIRWQLWKKKYNEKTKSIDYTKEFKAPTAKVLHGLRQTHEHLQKAFGKKPTFEEFQEKAEKDMVKWVNLQKISPYYLLMSPYIARAYKSEDLSKLLNFDIDIYKINITAEIENVFKELFSYEGTK